MTFPFHVLRTSLPLLAIFPALVPNHTPPWTKCFCHNTDGALIDCTDGHAECLDVTPSFFPGTHRYLYVDQVSLISAQRGTGHISAPLRRVLFHYAARVKSIFPSFSWQCRRWGHNDEL
jgi:hypothetical protein